MASKNTQTSEKINEMALKAFPKKIITAYEEISDGNCNAIYKITFTDKSKVILKIASADENFFMKNEANLMETEVEALKLVENKLSVKTPKLIYYDDSCTICSGKYLFMEYLEGSTYEKLSPELSKYTKETLDYKCGKLVKEIAEITGPKFGFLAPSAKKFDTLFDFVKYLLENTVSDAQAKNIDFSISGENLLELLEKDQRCFDVLDLEPTLVHFDMWQGNLLVQEEAITGIIDWERAIFGDPLMEDRFRLQKYTLPFFEGYRQSQFNFKETRRLVWYDIILYLSMMTEGAFRNYEDNSCYEFAAPLFKQALFMLTL